MRRRRRSQRQGIRRVVAGSVCVGLNLVLSGLWAEEGEVVDLQPMVVEAWHFDALGTQVAADVRRLEVEPAMGQGITGVVEFLEEVAGIRFRDYTGNGTQGELSLRGFGDNSGARVLLLVDGQVYNPMDLGGINWLGMELAELEVVEVLRGGQTVLYGNHALSGVVKLRMKPPGEEGGGYLQAAAGSNGERRSGTGWGRTYSGLDMRIGGSWTQSEGWRENSGYRNGTAFLSLGRKLEGGSRWMGRLNWNVGELTFPGPLSYQQVRKNPRQSNNGGGDTAKHETILGTFYGEGESPRGDWQVSGGLLNRQREWNLSGTVATNRQRQLNLGPRYRLEGEGASLIFGMDLRHDQLRFSEYLSEERVTRRARAVIRRMTGGGFVFFSRNLAERWLISGGIRGEEASTSNDYERFKEEQLRPILETNRGPVANPAYRNPPERDPELSYEGTLQEGGWAAELSLLHNLTDSISFWTGWDRVYRYPSVDESASFQGYPLSNPLNLELRPETGHSLEAGVKWAVPGWHVGLTGFVLFLDDEIAFDDASKLNTNIGDTRREGLAFDLYCETALAGANFRATLVRAAFRNGTLQGVKLPLVPEAEVMLNLWARLHRDWRLGASLRYFGSQYQGNDFANTLRKIPAVGLVDLGLHWNPRQSLSISLAVDNVFDRSHAVTAYAGGFYPGSGRRASCKFSYSF